MTLDGTSTVECVDRFCYLGDMVGEGDEAEEASKARVKGAWNKFREISPILTTRGASLRIKGKLTYKGSSSGRVCVSRCRWFVLEVQPVAIFTAWRMIWLGLI